MGWIDPIWIKAKPLAAYENQVGDSDPSGRADVLNRSAKGLSAILQRIFNTLFTGVTANATDQSTTTAFAVSALRATALSIARPKGRILTNGTILSNNGSDATNDIDIAASEYVSDDAAAEDRVVIVLSALTKQLDAAWAVGTNQGGLDTGAIANTTYHVWAILRSDTGVTDVLFSTSASAPTMPTNYDKKCRIGAILRESAAIVTFDQHGARYQRKASVLSIDVTAAFATAALRTLAVPTGVRVDAIFNAKITSGAGESSYTLFSDPAANDESPSQTATPLAQMGAASGSTTDIRGTFRVRTDTSGRIRHRGGADETTADNTLKLAVLGWDDFNGRA